MAKANKQDSKRRTKEDLFENFFHCAYEVLGVFESWFDADGVRDNFFGAEASDGWKDIQEREARTNRVRHSAAWSALSRLYDYAVDGNAGSEHPTDIVIGGAEVLSLITAENHKPCRGWDQIVALGDGRFALDEGEEISPEKLALLADVDIRTVRNAVSAGELKAFKVDDGLLPGVYIDNATARAWLQGRRGFKPTIHAGQGGQAIESIQTPADFAAYLCARREQLGEVADEAKPALTVPGLDGKALAAVEAGVFMLPLTAVNPLADFYQIDRKEFLDCVMRVFFSEYYAAIRESRNV